MRPEPRPGNENDGELGLPDALAAHLRALSRGPDVPAAIDRAVVEAARAHLGRARWLPAGPEDAGSFAIHEVVRFRPRPPARRARGRRR